jgi:hypothetical protein
MRVAGFAPGALLAVVGFGAPQPGTHVEVGGGPGAYHYAGGCDGPHNYANFVALQVRARHLEPSGLVIAAISILARFTFEPRPACPRPVRKWARRGLDRPLARSRRVPEERPGVLDSRCQVVGRDVC